MSDLQEEVAKLKQEFAEFKVIAFDHVKTQQRMISSRRGDVGPQGIPGPAGRDAVVKIQHADGKVQVVDPADGKVHAEIVAVPGPAGKDAVAPPPAKDGRDGAPGKPGKDSPSLDEIVKAVIQAVKSRL